MSWFDELVYRVSRVLISELDEGETNAA